MKLNRFIVIFILLCAFFMCACDDKGATTDNPSSVENIYTLQLIDNELCLLSNNRTVKKYDINPAVLPAEDILLLTDGIIVENENEADSFAENFDG